MELNKVGAFGAWFEMGVLDSIRAAHQQGARRIQLLAVDALDPLEMELDQIHLVKKLLKELGMDLTALAAEIGTFGLAAPKENEEKIFHLQKTMDLAINLGSRVVTMYPGVLPEDRLDPVYVAMKEACQELAKYAKRKNGCFALDTGMNTVAELSAFVDAVGVPEGLGINYDPASLVMSGADDEVAGVAAAGSRVVHVQVRDCKAGSTLPLKRYRKIFADGGDEALYEGGFVTETALGQGGVRWAKVLDALRQADYAGPLVIRHALEQARDVSLAHEIEYLQRLGAE